MMRALWKLLLRLLKAYAIAVIVLGVMYIVVPPPSTLMIGRWLSWQDVERDYVPIARINRNVISAVIGAEDDKFCAHWGIDFKSMTHAVRDASEGERLRGASTIPMQVAKNLFLWPQRSFVRKVLEVPVAIYLDLIWSKRRMMEIYLSVAEWGEGIYGIEAAAQAYFKKPASQLNAREAALLVAALPDPLGRNPAAPGPFQRGYAATILKRMGNADVSCFK